MANTYVLISSSTVGSGGTASITFSAIPATYTDLKIVGSTRQGATANGIQLWVTFNGTATGYSRRNVYGDGTSTASAGGSAEVASRFAWAEDGNYTANTFGNFELYIPNYTAGNQKSFSTDSVTENNATEAYAGLFAGLSNVTAAITSVTMTISSGVTVFAQYSTAYLYGIKNS